MEPDPLKAAWQSQTNPTLDRERILTELPSEAFAYDREIFWRDVREVGVSLAMAPGWIYIGLLLKLPWTWYLMVPAFLWAAGFLLVDRWRARAHTPDPTESLKVSVGRALRQVERQIWLLRNIAWWYLLPFALPAAAFWAQTTWSVRSGGWPAMAIALLAGLAMGTILMWVYWVNQAAVRDRLEPRRRELQSWLDALQDAPVD